MLRSLLVSFAYPAGELRWKLRGAERGQTLAEYSLILTLVAVGVMILALVIFRTELISAYASASSCLNGSC
ncbi:MAG: hypothetical protein HY723_00675 [Chloroflexi bacterium]|nr:hypothetical protein [Chloroflexota bacterium]